jgi:putative hydrolase of the HAD superfamily
MAAGMANEGTASAVLLDGMGTLLRLIPPAPALAAALGVDEGTAERAFRAEVAYYVSHHLEGSDPFSLEDLRARCALVLADAAGADPETAFDALIASLRFEPFPDAAPALIALRALGLRLVVVSNWDISLHEVLASTGLDSHLTGAITSAEIGVAKPSRAIFDHALTIAGVPAANVAHVGDSLREDVAGARAAGIAPVLVSRGGDAAAPRDVRVIRSLRELPALLDYVD